MDSFSAGFSAAIGRFQGFSEKPVREFPLEYAL
jgi:hypothetical protein